jgi:hypothetical protein
MLTPTSQPQVIPPPDRVWTAREWAVIRRGHKSVDMDDKWNAFVEDRRLFLHRSWTGLCIYEAEFAPSGDGWRIAVAVVAGDHDSYRRQGDEYESAALEAVIEWELLGVRGGSGEDR